MNDERWILATLKRAIAEQYRKDRFNAKSPAEILAMIAAIEAEAVLGEPEEQELPWAHLDDEKEDDR